MPTREQQLHAAVIASPQDDEPRRAYAEYIRPYDPPRAELIDIQLERAHRRRHDLRGGYSVNPSEEVLLETHTSRWAHTLERYTTNVTFSRGFIEGIAIDPHVFLEYGEWLYLNAPILEVTFNEPEEGSFPIDELAGSPLLARLDAIGLRGVHDAEVATFAASPHLDRCLMLDLSYNTLGFPAFEALATNPALRRVLLVSAMGDVYHPGDRLEDTGALNRWDGPVMEYGPVSPEGQALERTYGYIPWLHHENACRPFDARWFVEHGVLPVKPVGSPVT